MTAHRRRRRADLPRRGFAPTPQPCEVAAVPHLARHDGRAPDQRRDAARRPSCRCWRHEQNVAERPCRRHLEGIRCFDARTRQRPWPVVARVRPRRRHTLPGGWSPRAVRSLLAVVEPPDARRWLRRLEACGLRLRDGTPLPVAARDPHRLLVRGRQGTGGTARDGPLADRTRPR
jgi:hypothetical protein